MPGINDSCHPGEARDLFLESKGYNGGVKKLRNGKWQSKMKNRGTDAGRVNGMRCRSFLCDGGFTGVEMLVTITIITAISAIILVSFVGLREGAALNRSARELALAIRRVQNMSLAVTQVDTADGPLIPPAVGIQLARDAQTYLTFADVAHDHSYNPDLDDSLIGTPGRFEGGVRVQTLKYVEESAERESPLAHIVFDAPEAEVFLTDEEGESLGEILRITLVTPSGRLSKDIAIRTNGQVSIK